MMLNPWPIFVITAACSLCVMLGGCSAFDGYGAKEDSPDLQLEILTVLRSPDTVAVGDTITLKAITRDSLDVRDTFVWHLPELIPVNGTISGPVVKWKAVRTSDTPGVVVSVTASVEVDRQDQQAISPIKTFEIPVQN